MKKQIIAVVVLSTLLFFGSFGKARAYAGVIDIVQDPFNWILNSLTSTASGVSAGANTVTAGMTTADKIKTFVLDPAARTAVRIIIRRLTAQTVNWINSGFQGNPAYVSNPGQFFLNVGDNMASQFLSSPELNQLCAPFSPQVRLALVKNYINEESRNYSCSLGIIANNFQAFTRDFNQGGWDSWFQVTQNSGSNPYGAYLTANNALSKELVDQVNKYTNQLNQGRGFLSYERCRRGTMTAQGASAMSCDPSDRETVTPGSVIEQQLQNSLGTGIKQLELAKSFDEVLGALVTQLFTRVVGGGDGTPNSDSLRGNSQTQQLTPPQAPTPDQPVIILQGPDPLLVQTGTRLIDPGAKAFDSYNSGSAGVQQVDITDTMPPPIVDVDTSTPGFNYSITYNVTNSRGVPAIPVIRRVYVGVSPENANSCVTLAFTTYAANWPAVLAAYRIRLGDIDEGDIMQGSRAMIRIIDLERQWLRTQNRPEAVTKLEDLMIRLDRFSSQADRADEDSIDNVLQLERARDEIRALMEDLIRTFTCPIPNPTYNQPPVGNVPTPGGGGGTNVCGIQNTGTGSGAWNIVGTIDPATATVANADAGVLNWPETTQITGGSWNGLWDINFGARNTWPECPAFPGPPNDGPIQYTIWLFTNVNGQWVGTGVIRNWVGGTNNGGAGDPKLQLAANWIYDARWSPMPYCRAFATGEEVGFMVSNGNQRLGDGVQCTAVRERSNIVRVRLP